MHSLFDTIGGHSIHRKGQYHFEVYNGRIRWFHRNEYAKEVFNVRTSPILQPNVWYHVVGTYDSRNHVARVFVNGDLVGEGHGSGLLSLDWGAKAGFGSHSGRRILLGNLDEVYMYRRALLEGEIDRYLESMGGNTHLQPDSNSVYTESYTEGPSSDRFAGVNTDSVWFSEPKTHLTNMPPLKTPNTTLDFIDQVGETTKARLGTATAAVGAARPLPYTSKESQTTPFTTTKATETTATTTQSTAKPTKRPTSVATKTTAMPPTVAKTTNSNVNAICTLGKVYRNRDLVGGLGAGNFTDKGPVGAIEECMEICCGIKDCSVAYMVEDKCFAISCNDREQCKTFVKSPSENSPVIGFVDRHKQAGK